MNLPVGRLLDAQVPLGLDEAAGTLGNAEASATVRHVSEHALLLVPVGPVGVAWALVMVVDAGGPVFEGGAGTVVGPPFLSVTKHGFAWVVLVERGLVPEVVVGGAGRSGVVLASALGLGCSACAGGSRWSIDDGHEEEHLLLLPDVAEKLEVVDGMGR